MQTGLEQLSPGTALIEVRTQCDQLRNLDSVRGAVLEPGLRGIDRRFDKSLEVEVFRNTTGKQKVRETRQHVQCRHEGGKDDI